MKAFLIALLVVGVPAFADARAFLNEQNITSGNLVDYPCTSQGNFPDPNTCDCYIACTAALTAYQMPCPMGHSGRLWYVRDSGPSEQTSYCDEPQKVECDIDGPSTEAPIEIPPPVNGTCPVELEDGDDCNPMIDCNQCGFCDEYFYCHSDSPTTGKWRKAKCSVRGNPATDVIRVDDKMFFHRGATSYGGICAPGIPSELEEEYIRDPKCKNPCEFRPDAECSRAYWYSDPDYTRGIWSDPGTQLLCPSGTKWDQSQLTCVFCADGEACDCTPTKA